MTQIRSAYSRLGSAFSLQLSADQLSGELAQHKADLTLAHVSLVHKSTEAERLIILAQSQAQEHDTALQAQSQQLTELKAKLATNRERVTGLEENLVEIRAEHERLQVERCARDLEVARLSEDGKLLNEQLSLIRAGEERLRDELVQTRLHREKIEKDSAEKSEKIRALRAKLSEQMMQLEVILSSASWKMTKPFRRIALKMPRISGFIYSSIQLRQKIARIRGVLPFGRRKSHLLNAAGEIVTANPNIRIEIDSPPTREGVSVEVVTKALSVEGWAMGRGGGISSIEVLLDGRSLGLAHYGRPRPDVALAFPGWDGASESGFVFHYPMSGVPDGEHVVTLTVNTMAGESTRRAFRILAKCREGSGIIDPLRRRMPQAERDIIENVLADMEWKPNFSLILLDPGITDEVARIRTLRSILDQSWPDWNVTILSPDRQAGDASRQTVMRCAGQYAWRFQVIDDCLTSMAQLSDAVMSDAALVGFLQMGDELGVDALGSFALASGLNRRADVFYADEFCLVPDKMNPEPFLKPDYSPTLLLSTNYIGRPLIVRVSVVTATGLTIGDLVRCGLYDLVLRCVEDSKCVHHVTALLSRTDGSPRESQDVASILTRAMMRRGLAADVVAGIASGTWRLRPKEIATGKVSIIIPTRAANGHIEACLKTLRGQTDYRNFEIICAENIPNSEQYWKAFVREHADHVIEMADAFNWSTFNNRAAEKASGDFLLFLNDDIEIIEPDWLEAMLEDAMRLEVGVVGARLLYPDRSVQHAGMFLGADGVGRHAFRNANENDAGYFGLALTKREVIAVTGACMMMRREVFERLGRFDEAHTIVNNDLDFCLRVHEAGLLAIYTPFATLIHHEKASRRSLSEEFDTVRFSARWRTLFAGGDPYFNPGLSRHADDYRIDVEGVRATFASRPVLRREDVKRILIVKLDHIGDFITSLPAIRQLKISFPAARLTVLGAPASQALAHLEPAIDEFLPLAFFHASSQLGEMDLSQDDLDALTQRLAQFHFDLAVDLRKHRCTRHILQCAGARILAGFDSAGQFPWLDIALESDSDRVKQPKRRHITDDLLNLVGAIDAACEGPTLHLGERPAPLAVADLPEGMRHVFAFPVVAVHPGAGNANKQWPEAHFVDLIDILIDRNEVAVVLLGAEDEAALSESILKKVARPGRVASAVGKVSLQELPRLLATCALFIGNDSGPKHVASRIGVPTIGIHSGTVDPTEWGPIGERAVAMHRNMSCAPCYLTKIDDCPRDFACMRLLEPALVHQMAQMFLARPLRET